MCWNLYVMRYLHMGTHSRWHVNSLHNYPFTKNIIFKSFWTDVKKEGGFQFDYFFMFETSEPSTGWTDFYDSFFLGNWCLLCGLNLVQFLKFFLKFVFLKYSNSLYIRYVHIWLIKWCIWNISAQRVLNEIQKVCLHIV